MPTPATGGGWRGEARRRLAALDGGEGQQLSRC